MSNFESIATISSNAELELKSQTKNLKHEQQVNKQVSFNIIKNKVMDLFLSDKSTKKTMEWLNEVFKISPTPKRKWRKFSRKRNNPQQVVNYHKRKKKQNF